MKKVNWLELFLKTKELLKVSLRKYLLFLLHLSPHQNIAQTVISYTVFGTFILCLPFMTRGHVSVVDNFFTAAAAVSTSGLNSVNFAESYTF